MINRVNDIFAETSLNSLQDAELADCALALGQLGDAGGSVSKVAASVTRICDRFADGMYRKSGHSMQLHDLFQAFEGWALLGNREAALSKLRQIYADSSSGMEPYNREDYAKRLEDAAKWRQHYPLPGWFSQDSAPR